MEPPVHYTSYEEDSARWLGLALRGGDVVISTRSKSGTTWMQQICLSLVLGTPEFPDVRSRLSPWVDWLLEPIDDLRRRLDAQDHRRVLKTHTPLDGIPLDPSGDLHRCRATPARHGGLALSPGREPRSATDPGTLIEAFGPLRLLHLCRDDVVAQAVSWTRAEQTGYWHHGDALTAEPAFNLDQIDELVRTIQEHNAAWRSWFAEQDVRPYRVSYEGFIADPQCTVHGILEHLGIRPPATWRPASAPARQADGVNAEWIRRYRSARA